MKNIFTENFDGIDLTCVIEDGAVTALTFGRGETAETPDPEAELLWRRAWQELTEYFSGAREAFDLPLRCGGTEFQRQVWTELLRIPYGQTRTYGELARLISRPRAARAVGMACHNNPIAILIPCHRVLGSTGSLTGFAGGLAVKEKLLRLESGQ